MVHGLCCPARCRAACRRGSAQDTLSIARFSLAMCSFNPSQEHKDHHFYMLPTHPNLCHLFSRAIDSTTVAKPDMLPASRQSSRIRRDQLSIDIIPESSLDIGPRSPYLHWLFSDDGKASCSSQRLQEDSHDEAPGFTKTEAAVMEEVADWLQSRHCDEFWTPRKRTPRQVSGEGLVQCSLLTGKDPPNRQSASHAAQVVASDSDTYRQRGSLRESHPCHRTTVVGFLLYHPASNERRGRATVTTAERHKDRYGPATTLLSSMCTSRWSPCACHVRNSGMARFICRSNA